MDLSYLYFPFGITISSMSSISSSKSMSRLAFCLLQYLPHFSHTKKMRPKHRHIKLDNEFVKPLVIFYSLHPSPFNGKNRDAPVWEEICKYGSLFRFYWIWCFHHRVRKPSPTRNKIHSFIVKVDFEDNPCATVSNSLTCFNLVLHLLQTPNIWLAGKLNN